MDADDGFNDRVKRLAADHDLDGQEAFQRIPKPEKKKRIVTLISRKCDGICKVTGKRKYFS